MNFNLPRFVISGLSGDSGKTLVSVGLVSAFTQKGIKVTPFKKGPDYIDTSWLSLAAGRIARNLDTFLFGRELVLSSFLRNAAPDGLTIIEGNRGIYDGFDTNGSHSTAELAKILQAPIILIVNVQKMTRTAAAIVYGIKSLDIGINLAGVVVNNYSTQRQRDLVINAIQEIAEVEVVGAIPRIDNFDYFPSRHLGLITPVETERAKIAIENAKNLVEKYLDVEKIYDIACRSPFIFVDDEVVEITSPIKYNVKIGYFFDKAFSFYYPENLEALQNLGAELIPISAFNDSSLPEVDGLYIGGGFPENYPNEISSNRSLLIDINQRARNGLPIFAECGGLIFLAQSVNLGERYPFAGVFPIEISLSKKPIGHGYFEGIVDSVNPFFQVGEKVRGHEFHYSYVSDVYGEIETAIQVTRGVGIFNNRDGLIFGNVFASYLHLHSLGNPKWAENFVKLCYRLKNTFIQNS